ncbi:tetratricopeptide repeat protein [Rhodospirillaceae bacterium SYSU D60014]|uniref:tetratricopeptide repeat protein n=1 Tax=Virgifigura deserti TaxID=2268457 RepID=UPI000E666675
MLRSIGWLVATTAFLLAGCLYSTRPLIDRPVYPLSPGTAQEFQFEMKDGTAWLTPRVASDGRVETGRLEIVNGWYRYQEDAGGEPMEFKLADTEDPSVFVVMAKKGKREEAGFVYGAIDIREDIVISHGFMGSSFEQYIATSRWRDMPGWTIDKDKVAVFDSLPILQKALPEMVAIAPNATAYKPVDPAVVAAQKPAADPPDAEEAPTLDLSPPEPPSAREQIEKECREGTGIPLSCKIAGDMYANGDGGPVDLMRAGQFYAWGCEAGNSDSCGAAIALALIIGIGKAMTDPGPQSDGSQASSGEEWSPPSCCHGSEGNAPPPGSEYWQGHDLWCWTNFDYEYDDGSYPTWCQNSAGGVWEQPWISKCGGVEGWCD